MSDKIIETNGVLEPLHLEIVLLSDGTFRVWCAEHTEASGEDVLDAMQNFVDANEMWWTEIQRELEENRSE